MFIGSMKPLTPGASDTTKSSAFCVCCVVFAISFLQEQSDLAPHRLQVYANNFSKYMRQTYGRRSLLTLWGLGLYAYKQQKQLFVNILAS